MVDAEGADLLDGVVGLAALELPRVGEFSFGLSGVFLVLGAEIGLVPYAFLRGKHGFGLFDVNLFELVSVGVLDGLGVVLIVGLAVDVARQRDLIIADDVCIDGEILPPVTLR